MRDLLLVALSFSALAIAGCFSPSYQEGLSCSESGACPSGQVCAAGFCVPSGQAPEADAQTGPPADADTTGGPDAELCAQSPCSILPQCGCAEGACDLDVEALAEGGVACREVSIPGDRDSACAGALECAPGLVCLGGQCRNYCDTQNSCTAGQCLVQPVFDSGGGVFEPIPGATACTKDCAPEKSVDNGCPASPQFGCHLTFFDPDSTPDNGDEFYYSDCSRAPLTGGGDGADCSTTGDSGCQPGFECVGLGADTVCKQLCLVPGGACGVGTCSSFGDPVAIGAVEYGVCL